MDGFCDLQVVNVTSVPPKQHHSSQRWNITQSQNSALNTNINRLSQSLAPVIPTALLNPSFSPNNITPSPLHCTALHSLTTLTLQQPTMAANPPPQLTIDSSMLDRPSKRRRTTVPPPPAYDDAAAVLPEHLVADLLNRSTAMIMKNVGFDGATLQAQERMRQLAEDCQSPSSALLFALCGVWCLVSGVWCW